MKKTALRLLTVCLALSLLSPAVAETATGTQFTVGEKLIKQLEAGSGFTGTVTVESKAVEGLEASAITTVKPMVFDFTYIHVREDLAAKTPAENRVTLALTDGGQSQATGEFAYRGGSLYLRSSLTGDAWYAVPNLTDTASDADAAAVATADAATTDAATTDAATGALSQAAQGLIDNTAMPGLATFALSLLPSLHQTESDQWATSLDPYATKIDLWIEGYRQNAILNKSQDGVTTMRVDYTIPAVAIKAQLKQFVLDMLADTELLTRLRTFLPESEAERYLNPDRQTYYFYAIDQLPMAGDMTISRTLSLQGDTLALTLSMPMYDRDGGAVTLRYDRHKGEGDLPEENTVELRSETLLLSVAYQTYQTLTGTMVYQGTLLRQPLGVATYEVDAQGSVANAAKTLSAAFTLSLEQAQATDAEGKDSLTTDVSLSLTPEYTPETADDEPAAPTELQTAQYMVFDPVDLQFHALLTSGQAKNASTSADATLTISGENMPQTVTVTLSGKTKGKWATEAFDTEAATALGTMDAAALQALLAQAGIRGGLVTLPYLSLPTALAPTAVPAETVAP